MARKSWTDDSGESTLIDDYATKTGVTQWPMAKSTQAK